MISFQASVSKGWLHEHGGFTFDENYYLDPIERRSQDIKINAFVREKFGEYPIYNMEANLMQASHTNENQILVGGIQPNLLLSVALGANFVSYPDKDADVSGNPLSDISSPEDLPIPNKILEHPFIRQFNDQIDRLNREHPELIIIPPLFWDSSGRATIHGIITTSLKLIGDNAMMMTIMNPDLLHSVHQWIADTYMMLIKHFSVIANFPVTSVHVGECSGTMISNDQYIEFITPYVSQLGKEFRSIRLHSCGPSDHILQAISDIENLTIIDTGSNTSVAKIREMEGTNFEINLEPPVKLMLKNSSERAIISWLDQVLEENQGGPLKLALHLESSYSNENCMSIFRELRRRDLLGNV